MDLASARTRKFIGLFGILAFIAGYVWAMCAIAEFVPAHWAAQVVFFGVAGSAWGVPILPLIAWMNRGRQ
jgi:hypothetical protein